MSENVAFACILKLRARNALHLKRNVRLNDQSDEDVAKHLGEEVVELSFALGRYARCEPGGRRQDLIEELADVTLIAWQIAAKHGISYQELETEMLYKMRTRFAPE